MKLSKIVEYLNHLDTLSVESSASSCLAELAKINHVVENHSIQMPGAADTLAVDHSQVKSLLDRYEQNLKQLRADVFELVKQREPNYFVNSSILHQSVQTEPAESILKRTAAIDPDTLAFLRRRLQSYTDWRWPGMVIRPTHSPWVEDLVALDPLYFVDTHQELLTHASSKFTPEYQRRIRPYLIDEYTDGAILWNLPQRQFKFVYSFQYFNFRPWELLKQYLSEIFELLRDGGTFLFSFNDCDNWRSVGLVEHYFGCYTPGRLVKEHAVSLGYEIVFEHKTRSTISWLELRRPGTLHSIRGGQALAIILREPGPIVQSESTTQSEPLPDPDPITAPELIPVSVTETVPEAIDMSIQARYNRLDLHELIDLARMLSVDISNDKNKGMFNIKKVRRTVRQYLEEHNWPEKHLKRLFKRNPK
jgi:SAM-dependent methyltransferase